MKVTLVSLGFVAGYGLLYLVAIIGTLWMTRRGRKTRWPFKDTDKLLRGPGESLRRKIAEIDERLMAMVIAGFVAGAMGILFGAGMAEILKFTGWTGLIVRFGPVVAAIAIAAVYVRRIVRERWNAYLGWFGERLVAEKLRPLLGDGFRVFHDMPAQGAKKAFNLDHIVVGPPGVTVIEVKSRRKGNGAPGQADHKVAFDGTKLVWPWGNEEKSIQQALNTTDWIAQWIFERTGLKVPVRAVLTVPGWYVTETPSPRLRVVNPDFLPDAVRGHWTPALKPEQIDLIARQIELVCRDVED